MRNILFLGKKYFGQSNALNSSSRYTKVIDITKIRHSALFRSDVSIFPIIKASMLLVIPHPGHNICKILFEGHFGSIFAINFTIGLQIIRNERAKNGSNIIPICFNFLRFIN